MSRGEMMWATPQTPLDEKPSYYNVGDNIRWQWIILNFIVCFMDQTRNLGLFIFSLLLVGFSALVSIAAYKLNMEKVREDDAVMNIVEEFKTGTGKSLSFLVLLYTVSCVYYCICKLVMLFVLRSA